jgi:hypothetical protein
MAIDFLSLFTLVLLMEIEKNEYEIKFSIDQEMERGDPS